MIQSLQFFNSSRLGLLAELDQLDSVFGSHNDQILVWHTNQSLVVPSALARMPFFAQAVERSTERGWPVYVRPTGGGTTPQGPGILNVCLAFQSASRSSIHAAYRRICDPLQRAFSELGIHTTCQAVPGSFCDGDFNIAHAGQKLVGTAQRWRTASAGVAHGILAHALILHSTDIKHVTQAINAFHRDLELDIAVVPAAHTTVDIARGGIDERSFAHLLVKHIDSQLRDLQSTVTDSLTVSRGLASVETASAEAVTIKSIVE